MPQVHIGRGEGTDGKHGSIHTPMPQRRCPIFTRAGDIEHRSDVVSLFSWFEQILERCADEVHVVLEVGARETRRVADASLRV